MLIYRLEQNRTGTITPYGQSHPCPLRSPVAQSPTLETVWQSFALLPLRTSSAFAASLSNLSIPESHSSNQLPRLFQ